MKRRTAALALALTLALSLLCPAALAAGSGPLGESVTGTLDEEGTLTVSGSGPMANYEDCREDSWYYRDRQGIKTLEIGDGVTSVGDYVFWNLNNLTSVRLGRDVTSIGTGAFLHCNRLKDLILPEGVVSIGDRAFQDCNFLDWIYIPAGLRSLGEDVFSGCNFLDEIRFAGTEAQWAALIGDQALPEDLKRVVFNSDQDGVSLGGSCGDGLTWALDGEGTLTIRGQGAMEDFGRSFDGGREHPWASQSVRRAVLEEGVTSVGAAAFSDCANLASVSLPSTLKSIGDMAFAFCQQLESPALPAGLVSIGDKAFWFCDAFQSITIPAGVKEMGANPFPKCHNLTEILVEEGCTACRFTGGVLYSGDGKTLICYPTSRKDVFFSVPAGVTAIGDMAFFVEDYLHRVTLPEGVTRIGDSAFFAMTSLTRLDLPLSLREIGPDGVAGCEAFTDVWYAGVKSDWEAVSIDGDNDSLLRAAKHFADGTVDISLTAHGYCGKSEQPFTGEPLPSPDDDFSEYWAESASWTLDSLGTLHISGEGSLCETPRLIYPDLGYSIVPSPWWDYSSSIKRIVIDEGITYIRRNNFRDCPNLTDLVLPVSLQSVGIDTGAFTNDDSLKDVWFRGTEEEWKTVRINSVAISQAEIHYNYREDQQPELPEPALTSPVLRGTEMTVTASSDRPAAVLFALYDSGGRLLRMERDTLGAGETRECVFSTADAVLQGEGGGEGSETLRTCRVFLLDQNGLTPLCEPASVSFW